jgi:hypothetical protein
MKYSIVVGLIFLTTAVGTDAMQDEGVKKKVSIGELPSSGLPRRKSSNGPLPSGELLRRNSSDDQSPRGELLRRNSSGPYIQVSPKRRDSNEISPRKIVPNSLPLDLSPPENSLFYPKSSIVNQSGIQILQKK